MQWQGNGKEGPFDRKWGRKSVIPDLKFQKSSEEALTVVIVSALQIIGCRKFISKPSPKTGFVQIIRVLLIELIIQVKYIISYPARYHTNNNYLNVPYENNSVGKTQAGMLQHGHIRLPALVN